jgi:hypothetical protein
MEAAARYDLLGESMEWRRTTKGEPGRFTLATESQPVPHPPGTPAIGSVETGRGTTAKIWPTCLAEFIFHSSPICE